MKALKISLVVIVITSIIYFVMELVWLPTTFVMEFLPTTYLGGHPVPESNFRMFIEPEIEEKTHKRDTIEADPYHEIIVYLEGLELNRDTLRKYKQEVKDEEIKKRIEASITFRTNLNKGEISKIQRSTFQYSEAQQVLQKAINNINDTKRQYIAGKLNRTRISKMTLDEVAAFITEQIAEFNDLHHVSPDNNITMVGKSEIITYLKGADIRRAGLEEYKTKTIDRHIIQSINLALKFWRLDARENNSYYSYLKELEKDSILKESELKNFVKSKQGIKQPKYVQGLRAQHQEKSLKELKEKL